MKLKYNRDWTVCTKPSSLPSGTYKLVLDDDGDVVVAEGELQGVVWPTTKERFLQRERLRQHQWKYSGWISCGSKKRRYKVIHHQSKSFPELVAPGLRKLYLGALAMPPPNFASSFDAFITAHK